LIKDDAHSKELTDKPLRLTLQKAIICLEEGYVD